jgi:hypothetical protein
MDISPPFRFEENHMTIPEQEVPERLYSSYTMGGAVRVESWYFNESYSPDSPKFYAKEEIVRLSERAMRHETNYYGKTDEWLYQALDKYSIKGLEVAVIGSATPWYEGICLCYGAKCTTIEYNKIVSDHPGITFMTVDEYKRQPKRFDAALSISSFEHDGLGRYGDPLNPNGDLEAMQSMKQILKSGGLLFLAVPVGKDKLVWNAHRIYGRRRLRLLLEGWKTLDTFGYHWLRLFRDTGRDGSYQPIFVLKNSLTMLH